MTDAPAHHGSHAVGAVHNVDLKKRIEGFGNGPEPPPLEEEPWWATALLEIGDSMGLGPTQTTPRGGPQAQQEAPSIEDTITSWVESAKQGWDAVVSALDEELSGEPRMQAVPPPPPRIGQGALAAASAASDQAQKSARERAAEDKDTPGTYQINCADTLVSQTRALGGEVVAKLQEGAVVNVIEVVRCEKANRIRALIDEPCGWISLYHLQTGFRWAEKVDKWRKVTAVPNAMGCSDSSHGDKADAEANTKNAGQELLNLDGSNIEKKNVAGETQTAELIALDADSPSVDSANAAGKNKALISLGEDEAPKEELLSFDNDSAGTDAVKVGAEKESDKTTSPEDDHSGKTNGKGVCVAADDLAVGDKVMRKGEEAVIVAIDRSMEPPGFTVRMSADGREISTEGHLLQKLPGPAATEAAATAVFPNRGLACSQEDGDLLSLDEPQIVATATPRSRVAATAEAPIPRLPPPPQKRHDQVSVSPAASVSSSVPRGISIFGEEFNPPPRRAPEAVTPAAFPSQGNTESSLSSSTQATPTVLDSIFEAEDQVFLDPCSNTAAGSAAASAPAMCLDMFAEQTGDASKADAKSSHLPRAPRGISLFDPLSEKNFNDLALG